MDYLRKCAELIRAYNSGADGSVNNLTPMASMLSSIVSEAVSIQPLVWSKEFKPSIEVPYNHIFAETPFGRFLLTWKEWRGCSDIGLDLGFDETPWGDSWCDGFFDIEDAKSRAEQEMNRRLRLMIGVDQ